MISRFAQLFILCAVVILAPTLLYLSRDPHPQVIFDPASGHWYSADSVIPIGDELLSGVKLPGNHANAQLTQGNGPEPAGVDPGRWAGLMDPIHKASNMFDWGKKPSVDQEKAKEVAALKAAAAAAAAHGGHKDGALAVDALQGGAIMGKMKNETAKAELGRATWRFLHTMTLRYPEKPTEMERETLKSFMLLFSRLYPCGECASHFQKLLAQSPPQTSSRKAASMWLCSMHNKVNLRLKKPEYDCTKLEGMYDCGCGDSGSSSAGPTSTAIAPSETSKETRLASASGKELKPLAMDEWRAPPLPLIADGDGNLLTSRWLERDQQLQCACAATR